MNQDKRWKLVKKLLLFLLRLTAGLISRAMGKMVY
jgi:hypothetical protein